MSDLRTQLLRAKRNGELLKSIHESFRSRQDRETVSRELANLHNEGELNLVEEFRTLNRASTAGGSFFITRDVFGKALPLLTAPMQAVMECVLHLVKEAGADMAAGQLYPSFVDFCIAQPTRSDEAIAHIKKAPATLADFVSPAIVAGARMDIKKYIDEAIDLAVHEDMEIRKRAVFSLGQIQYSEKSEWAVEAMACLEKAVAQESDGHILGNAICSICNLCAVNGVLVERGAQALEIALSKGKDSSLHAAADQFGLYQENLSPPLLEVIMRHLLAVKPENQGTVDMIDHGISHLLGQEDPTQGVYFLESLLLAHHGALPLASLNSVVYTMTSKQKLLEKILTRWFLKGDQVLCKGILHMVNEVHGTEMCLKIDPAEIPSKDHFHLICLARKSIGYLFTRPITAASLIVSLMGQTQEKKTIAVLGRFLFDPLLLNYSGQLLKHLETQTKTESGHIQIAIQAAIDNFLEYLDGLKSVGTIPEMHSSQRQRETELRRVQEMTSKSYKEAMKGSIVNLLCKKSVILYGNKSISYIHGADGATQRVEIPMSRHAVEMEFPRQLCVDPIGLDRMLRICRAERISKI